MEYIVYDAQISPDLNSELEVNFIGLVDKPAIERNFQAFNNAQKFALNEEKKIISGPAMIADMPIYRNDNALGEYYVTFNKPSIQTIVEKFAAKGFMKNFNLFHDEAAKVSDITIFNSFIVDPEIGINAPANFPDLPPGSWFISAKVNNDAVWSKVKDGTIKGFSVEGIFQYMPVAKVKMTAEQAERQIRNILAKVEIEN